MVSKIPAEIERLWKLGFAVHWLKPKSKVPIAPGWTKGERLEIEKLRETYRPTFNYGVRLGRASNVAGAFLAVLDVDVKSNDPRHRAEALAKLFELYPEVEKGPHLLSGRGNGSAHYYVRVPEPVAGNELKARSRDMVTVRMPSVPPSKRELDELEAEAIEQGMRLRPAWEISLLCEGRQAAVVGSVHPDTGKAYTWGKAVNGTGKDIPLLEDERAVVPRPAAPSPREALKGARPLPRPSFEAVDVDSLPLTDEQKAAVVDGTGVEDRSAKIYEICLTLAAASVPDETILSLFTDRELYLGNCAYDHAKTPDRARAARWIERYCLAKAKSRTDLAFDVEPASDEELRAKKKAANDARPKVVKERVWPAGLTGTEEWEEELELKYSSAAKASFVKSTLQNISTILEKKAGRPDFLRLEEFAQRIVWTCDTPWGTEAGAMRSAGNEDVLRIKQWFSNVFRIEPPNVLIEEALTLTALHHKFHAVRDYLDGLEWDGKERLAGAFRRYLGATMPEPYLSTVTRKFFLACVKRIYEPGCKFDHVVVLEGKQGVGKSTFGNILVGGDWFMDGLPNFQDKDAALNLAGIWLCELGELATVYRSQNEAAKAFLTRNVDKIRPPYGQRRVEYRRSTVFLGTTDKTDYLTDSAGNRRYWPVKVKQCDFAALAEDRDQLWAEATFNYFFSPEPLYLSGEALHQARAVQELRRIEDEGDAMEYAFLQWRRAEVEAGGDVSRLSIQELFRGPPWAVLPATRANAMRAAEILRKLGYWKKHTNLGNVWIKK